MSRSNPYVKTTWVDEETELSAAQLNRIEQGIYDAHDAVIAAEDALATTKTNLIEDGTTDTAKKAVSDSNGNPIDSTYATKTENNLNLLKGDGTGTQYMYDALKIQTFLIAQLIKSFGDKIRINLIDDNETTALEILVNYNESNQVRLLFDATKLQVTDSNNKKLLYEFANGISVNNVPIPDKTYVDTEDNKRIKYTDTVNNLTDTSTTNPLSAAQGKALKDMIDDIYTFIGTSSTDSDTVINRLKDVFAFLASVDDEQTLLGLLSAKIAYADLVKNLTTNSDDLPLAASQGYALKGMIDSSDTEIAKIKDGRTVIAEATKATQDGLGNNIANTYMNRSDAFAVGMISVTNYDESTGIITLRYNNSAVTSLTYDSTTGILHIEY